MDIRIEKKKGIRALFTKKGIPYLAGALFLVFVLWLLLRDNSSTLRVDARTISVGQVVSGEFNDYIRVTGQVQPITTVQLSPLEAGIVERLVVEEGTSVKKGDVLVVLSNTSLTLEILNSEAELAEKQNILRNTLISMEQEKLSLRQDKAQLDLDVSRKKRAWQQNEELYRNALIAREEWLQSKEDYELAEKKRELNIERQVQDSLYRSVQIEQMEENLDNMKRNMQLIRERIGNLNVKSPIDGEVGLLDIVLGQSVSTGQKIGQINDLSDYKVEAQIDESYIDRVRAGLEATFDRQGTDYKVRLRKVYPRCAAASSEPTSPSWATIPRTYAAARPTTCISNWGSLPRRSSSPAGRSTRPRAAHGFMSLRPRATRLTNAPSASAARTRSITRCSTGWSRASGSSFRAMRITARTTC